MCGIFCTLYCTNKTDECYQLDNYIRSLLLCRGPDANGCLNYRPTKEHSIYMLGSTLWMQGPEPCVQPLESDNGALLFNGDIYHQISDDLQNDTEYIFSGFEDSISHENNVQLIKNLVGPFSLIYLDKRRNVLYFCRDRYGRKSLLYQKNNHDIVLSSVLYYKYENAIEVPAKSIYCLHLSSFTLEEYFWDDDISTGHIVDINNLTTQSLKNGLEDTELSSITPEISTLYNEVEEISSKTNNKIDILKKLLTMDFFSDRVNKLIDLLSESVKVRVSTQPTFCKKCINSRIQCGSHCRVGVLFSGGLDCTILAALAHKHIPLEESIDLLNVAFEHKNCKDYKVPDRLTSLESLHELEKLFPERKWNLLQINISTEELRREQKSDIGSLIYPLEKILDESLGSALWFAARGKVGDYESTCRVILMGMGADEIFGGYTRHRNSFRRGGWPILEKELKMDWERLPFRNLGRDDRIVSHHGRQPRTPYLDEKFLKYVLQLKPWERCFPSRHCEAGLGDKLLLRLTAMKLGLENVSIFPKRAIQFGSKIANKNVNADDISPRLIQE